MGTPHRSLGLALAGLALMLTATGTSQGQAVKDAKATADASAPTGKEAKIVAGSYKLLREFVNDEEKGIPSALLREARGVALFPRVVQGGFLVGGSRGHGILMTRDSKGEWSNPVFLTVTGGSFGLQAGAEGSEVLLVFRDLDTIRRLMAGKGSKLTFGAGASAAIGPIGRGVGAGTDPRFDADILVYSRGKGAYAGAKLGGSMVHVDKKGNASYYKNPSISVARILGPEGSALTKSPTVEQIHKLLPRGTLATARSDKAKSSSKTKTSTRAADDEDLGGDDDEDLDAQSSSGSKRG